MLKPVNDRFIVKPVEAPTQTSSGLFLPETHTDDVMHGEVVAIGRGHLCESGDIIPLVVQVGDVVAFPKASGVPYKSYFVLQENAIYGIVD